ncbi:MAG: hypothetical protein AVDCRST_MAG59-4636, partial [uncultured Thermomicrobiales bacterium]
GCNGADGRGTGDRTGGAGGGPGGWRPDDLPEPAAGVQRRRDEDVRGRRRTDRGPLGRDQLAGGGHRRRLRLRDPRGGDRAADPAAPAAERV